MEIVGKKYLNSNDYSRIIIYAFKNDFRINIKAKDKFETLNNSFSFTDTIKDLNRKDQVVEVVEHFLRNSNIVSLKAREYLPNLPGWYSTVRGSNGRILALMMGEKKIMTRISKVIMDKYNTDRTIYYLDHDVKEIECSKNEKSYGDKLCLNIKYKDGIEYLPQSEISFLRELILSKVDYINPIYINKPRYDFASPNVGLKSQNVLVGGGIKINYNSNALIHQEIIKIVNEYNNILKNRELEESCQLKLKI